MKRILSILATLVATLTMVSCDEWLSIDDQPQDVISTLSKDVDFEATNVICKHFEKIYGNYPNHDCFIFELTSDENNYQRDALILNLLVPHGTQTFVGEYAVGYDGDYIALSRFNIYDANSGVEYLTGSFYGRAIHGYIGDYYGFLTEGKVTITPESEEGEYSIDVDAKSLERTVRTRYTGKVEIATSADN